MSKRKAKKRNPAPQIQEPLVETMSPPIETPDRRFWPEDTPMPETWVKVRRALPCRKCRRVLLDDNGQAVVCISSANQLAWFRCRACGHRFKLPVQDDR